MADPISALSLVFSAARVGIALRNYIETREAREQQRLQNSTSRDEGPYPDRLFLVMSVLGQWLLLWGVIDVSVMPSTHRAVRQALVSKAKHVVEAFDELELPLQYAVASAYMFCSACYPMPIHTGFGNGVLNAVHWGGQDQFGVLALLASIPYGIQPLTKVLSGLNRMTEFTGDLIDEKELKKAMKVYKEYVHAIDKRGMPQPKDRSVHLRSWWIPSATYGNAEVLYNHAHDFSNVLQDQQDPGRLLYGCGVGGHLNLREGEAMVVLPGVAEHVICWLEGLSGTNFRLIPSSEMDYSHLKLGRTARKLFVDDAAIAYYAVRDVKTTDALAESGSPRTEVPTVRLSSPTLSSGTEFSNLPSPDFRDQAAHPRRRPAPPPPAPVRPVLRQSKARYDFFAEGDSELSFVMGDVLDVLKEVDESGWCEARLDGREGIVPRSYIL